MDKFETDLLKTNEDIAHQSREILWWGPGTDLLSPLPTRPRTNVCQFLQLYAAVSLHA